MTDRISRAVAAILIMCCTFGAVAARANPTIVVDAANGKVLHADEPTRPWYPASLTKLLTFYTVARAIRDGRIDADAPIVITPRAARQAPSKMGYPVGTMVTVDDALKMLIVQSANDIAVALAENVSGSVDAFAVEMNAYSRRLGMSQSHWVNPHGLPDRRQVSSARDMAILADAIITQFPEYAPLFTIQSIQSGERVMRSHNALIYRYPGADGMKTGFTCASGFNIVATASRNGRRLITVIMGAATPKDRTDQAVELFETNYNNAGGGFFKRAPLVTQLKLSAGHAPPDIRDIACKRKKAEAVDAATADTAEMAPPTLASQVLIDDPQMDMPVPVGPYTGPRRPALQFADAPVLIDQPARPVVRKPVPVKGKPGKKSSAGKPVTQKPPAAPRSSSPQPQG